MISHALVRHAKLDAFRGSTNEDIRRRSEGADLGVRGRCRKKFDTPIAGLPGSLFLSQYPGDAKVDPYKDVGSLWSRYNHDSIGQYCRLNP